MNYFLALIILLSSILASSATRVIELSDRFIELRGDTTWVIMFYAPWCGHCKKLEPTWNHVSQALYNTEVRVGKADCTRFTSLATYFRIKGFPTIMFIRGEVQEVYKGDRTRDEIIGFALRMSAAPVPHLDAAHLERRTKEHDLFFLFAGRREGDLWEAYYSLALYFRHFHYLYSAEAPCLEKFTELRSNPAVLVYKDHDFFQYPVPDSEIYSNLPALNKSLSDWINDERFPLFMKFTSGNLPELWKVHKLLAIAVIQEDKIGNLNSDERSHEESADINAYKYKDNIESIVKAKRTKYEGYFQFGWTGTPELVNSIAMERLRIPNFIVVETSSMNHFMPAIPAHQLDENTLEEFLDSVVNKTAVVYGGDTYFLRLYRMYYNAKTSIVEMWTGNPVLTSVLFGLPAGFLMLICYSIWCSDILDADEESEETAEPQKKTKQEPKQHEKED